MCVTQYHGFVLCDRQVFCDFGEEFVISDVTGEQPISVIISSVTKVTFTHTHTHNCVLNPGVLMLVGHQECGDLFR